MANKDDDFDLDDFNFDNFDDGMDAGFDGPGSKDDRHPAMKVAGGFKEGLTSHLRDPRNQVNFIKKALPEGYTKAIDTVDGTIAGAREIYDHTMKEAAPLIKDTKSLLRKAISKDNTFFPKKWVDKLHEDTEGGAGAPTQEQIEETAIGSALAEVFKTQSQKEDEKYKEQKEREDIRTALNLKGTQGIIAQLLSIRRGTERLVGYQDEITAQFQRKTLELQYRSYFVQRRLLESFQQYAGKTDRSLELIVKNTGLPEEVKVNNSEMIGRLIKEKLFNDSMVSWASGLGRKAIDKAKANISDFFQTIGSGLSMAVFAADTAESMAELTPGGKAGMVGQTLGSSAGSYILNKLATPLREILGKNETIRKGHFKLTNMFRGMPQFVSDYFADSEKFILPKGFEGIERAFKDFMGETGFRRDTTIGQTEGIEDLDKATHLRQLTRRSIEEVIPGWLSKIHHELKIIRTGDASVAKEAYSFKSASFENVEDVAEGIRKEIYNKTNLKDIRKAVMETIKQIDDGTMEPSARKVLFDLLIKNAQKERIFNPLDYIDAPGGLGEYIIQRYSLSQDVQTRKWKLTGDSNYYEDIDKAAAASEVIKSKVPDIRRTLSQHFQAGDAEALMKLGIVSKTPDGQYVVDEDKYMNLLRSGEWRNKVPGSGMGFDNRVAGGMVGGLYSPLPSQINLNQTAVPQAQPSMDLGDRIDTVMSRVAEDIIAAIDLYSEQYSSRAFVAGSNELLAVIIEMMKAGIPQGDATGQGGKMHWADRAIHGVLDMGKGIKNFAASSIKAGNKLFGKAVKFATGGLGWIKDQGRKMLDYYNKTDFNDIYIRGKEKAVLLARDLRDGKYFDENGKVIKSLRDIKGAVYDAYGNVVIQAEELKDAFEKDGRPLLAKLGGLAGGLWNKLVGLSKPIESAYNFAKNMVKSAFAFAKAHTDVYVRGETTPRLLARIIRAGGYRLQATGKVIESVKDIIGNIIDNDGNVVLTGDDIQKGLVDKHGQPIQGLAEKAMSFIARQGARAITFGKDAAVKAWELLGKGASMIKGGFGWLKNKVGDVGMGGGAVNVLERIYTLLDERLPGKKRSLLSSDIDNDGDREGSWQDRAQRREEAAREERRTGWMSRLKGMFTSNKQKKEEARAQEPEEDTSWISGIFDKFGLGFIGDKLSGVAKRLVRAGAGVGSMVGSAIGSVAGKIAELVGGGLSGVAGKLMGTRAAGALVNAGIRTGGALVQGGRMAASLAGAGLNTALAIGGSSLGALATGLMGILTAPVTLTVGAIALAGYAAYNLGKNISKANQYLSKFRMLQYGFDPGGIFTDGDDEEIEKIIELEAKLMPYVSNVNGKAMLQHGVLVEELLQLFEVDMEDPESVKDWVAWFANRFKPVFLSHMTALYGINKTQKLNLKLDEIDDKMPPGQKLVYLKAVHFPLNAGPYMVPNWPFPNRWFQFGRLAIDIEPSDIQDAYDTFEAKIQKEEAKYLKKGGDNQTKKEIEKVSKDKEKPEAKKDDKDSWWNRTKLAIGGTIYHSIERMKKIFEDAKKYSMDMASAAAEKGKAALGFLGDIGSSAISGLTGLGSAIGTAAAKYVAKRGNAKENESIMIKQMIAAGITDPTEQAMLLAQLDHESAGFTTLEENLNYRAETLMKISATAKSKGIAAVTEAVKQGPAAIAELMYGGRMGNDMPGDGFKYRGRGFIQLTGKDNYAAASAALGIDLVKNPDLASHPENAAKLAIWFWKNRVGSLGKSGDAVAITKRINGGLNGLEDRKRLYAGYLAKAQKGELTPSAPAGDPTKTEKLTPGSQVASTTAPVPTSDDVKKEEKAIAASNALKAASPEAVVGGPSPAPTVNAGAPGLVAASYKQDAKVQTSKLLDKLTTDQLEAQRKSMFETTKADMAGVVDLLGKQVVLQVSMEASLRTIAEVAVKGAGGSVDADKTGPGNTNNRPTSQRVANAGINTNGSPLNMSKA